MYVLRTARELAAKKLEVPLSEVGPDTRLPGAGEALVAELLGAVEAALADEQGLAQPPAASGRDLARRLARVGLEPPTSGSETVAEAAEVVTRAAVRALVADRLDVPAAEISADLSYAVDLGADSLTRVDLVLLLEEALDVSVPDDSMSLVQTVGDSELFAVLYDRTREGLVAAFGEDACAGLAYNTPLARLGADAGDRAIDAASRAAGMELPRTTCATLQDAVRLAFLARRLRQALATEAGADPDAVAGHTMPVEDLGLSADRMTATMRRLAGAMDLALPADVTPEQIRTVAQAVATLTGQPSGVDDRGAAR